MKQYRPKAKGECFCMYCNCTCNPETDEFIVTKRKDLHWFHKRCYCVYNQIGFNPVDEMKGENNVIEENC